MGGLKASGFRSKLLVPTIALVIVTSLALLAAEAFLHFLYYTKNGHWLFRGVEAFRVTYVKPVDDRREYSLRENTVDPVYSINFLGFRGDVVPPNSGQPVV